MPILIVPAGAEEQAVRRAAPRATLIVIRAGKRAASLPDPLPADDLIVIGLCGALRRVRTGDVVVYDAVSDAHGREDAERARVDAICASLPGAVRVGACTADHVVTRATERATLATTYDADVVDMEGTHIARALTQRGRTAMTVRVASDDPSFDLPPIEDAFDQVTGAIRPLHLARAFALKPVAAGRFIRDVQRSLRVLGETAAALTR